MDSSHTNDLIKTTPEVSGCCSGHHGGRCPRYGYCPCCGRGGGWYLPVYPSYPPYYVGDPPWWYQQTWCGQTSDNVSYSASHT